MSKRELRGAEAIYLLLPVAIAIVALVLLAPPAAATTYVGGAISTDTTWAFVNSPYVVTSTVTVSGTAGPDGVTTLTIEPGTQVLFNTNTQLVIATSSVKGALNASGTAGSPILLTSNQTTHTRGSWNGVVVNSQADPSITHIENTTIEYAGSNGDLYILTTSPVVRNATFRESSAYGLRLDASNANVTESVFMNNTLHGVYIPSGGGPTFRNDTFANNSQYGLYTANGIPVVDNDTFTNNTQRPLRLHVESLLTGARYSGNGIQEIEEIATPNALMTKDREVPRAIDSTNNTGIPYVMLESFTIRGTDGADGVTTMIVDPGVEMRWGSGRSLAVAGGSAGQLGALAARGTSDLPILMTSNQAAGAKTRGFWSGITFNDLSNDSISGLENLTVEYAGGTAGVYLNNANTLIRNAVVSNSSTVGVRLDVSNALLDNSSFNNNTQHGVYIPSGGAPTIRNSDMSNNSQYGLYTANGIPILDGDHFWNNTQRPLRIHVESPIGQNNTFGPNGIQEAELMATPNGLMTMDREWPRLIDSTNGTTIPWVVTASFTIRGTDGPDGVSTLTIDPGAEVRFVCCAFMDVSTNTAGQVGALSARGTQARPILFTSSASPRTRGSWGAIRFWSQSADNLSGIENATIEYGGNGGQSMYVVDSYPILANLTIQQSSGQGIYLDATTDNLTDSTITNNTANGVYIRTGSANVTRSVLSLNGQNGIYTESGIPTIAFDTFVNNTGRAFRADVDSVMTGNAFENNTLDEVELIPGNGWIDNDQHLERQVDRVSGANVPYVFAGSTYVIGTSGSDGLTTLTIDPGAELHFRNGVQLGIGGGNSNQPGSLNARGTKDLPIVFTSDQAAGSRTPGFWRDLLFHNYADDATSVLENATFEAAGYASEGSIYVYYSAPTIKNVTITKSAPHGLTTYEAPVTLRDITIADSGGAGGYGMVLTSYSNVTHPHVLNATFRNLTGRVLRMSPDMELRDTHVSGATDPILEVSGQTATLDARWYDIIDDATGQTVPYLLTSSMTVQGNDGADNTTTLTIDPGATVRMNDWGTRLVVGGSCCSSILTGSLVARGTHEQPILFTSQPNAQYPGGWGRIEFYDGAVDATSALENVTLEYGGGYWSTGVLYVENALPTIKNDTIRFNDRDAVYLYASPVRIQDTTFESNGNSATDHAILYYPYYSYYTTASTPHMALLNVTIANSTGWPARIAPDTDIEGLTLLGNGADEVELVGGAIHYDTTWPRLVDAANGSTIHYDAMSTITVAGADGPDNETSLTIAPGADARWSQGGGLTIGDQYLYQTTGLRARGGSYDLSGAAYRFLNGSQAGAGCDMPGPDIAGYTCASIHLNFDDISATGAPLALYDDNVVAIPIGFDFTFYGHMHQTAYVSSNGFVSFTGDYNAGCCSGQQLPDPGTPNDLIAGYWEDLNVGAGGSVKYQTIGTAPDRELIVQWTNVPHYYNTVPVTFEIVLYENDSSAEVRGLNAPSDGGYHVTGVESPGLYTPRGELVARGTEDLPIHLGSGRAAPAPGDWSGIRLSSSNDNRSAIENVTLDDACTALDAYATSAIVRHDRFNGSLCDAVYLDLAPIRVEDSIVENSGSPTYSSYHGIAVYADNAPPDRAEIVNVTIANTTGRPLMIAADTLLQDLTLTNSSIEEIEVSYGTGVRDATWHVLHAADTGDALPYALTDWVTIAGRDGADHVTTLSIDPGVEVRGENWSQLRIGDPYAFVPGALHAEGSASEPILFTSAQTTPQRGDWDGLAFFPASNGTSSILANASIVYGGRSRGGALYLEATSPTIHDVTVASSDTYGVWLEGAPATLTRVTIDDTSGFYAYGLYSDDGNTNATLDHLTVTNTRGTPMRIAPDTILDGTTLSNNTRPVVDVISGAAGGAGRWEDLLDLASLARVPYVAEGSITIQGSLAIDRGVEARFNWGSGLTVTNNGSLAVRGGADDPVVFTSARPEGVRYDGDWGGIAVIAPVGPVSIANATIEFAGASGVGGLYIDGAAPEVRGLVASRDVDYGVYATGVPPGFILADSSLVRSTNGLHLDNASFATILHNNISAFATPITFDDVTHALVRQNRVASEDGVFSLNPSDANVTVVDNNFTRELGGSPVQDDGTDDVWSAPLLAGDNVIGGPTLGGNYYSDYPGFDISKPSDGIGDTGLPYVIPGAAGTHDMAPLVIRERWEELNGAPQTAAQLLGHLTDLGWYQGDVQVQLTAIDAENDSFTIHVSVDGGSFFDYTDPVLVAGDGQHNVSYYAVDRLGNTERLRSIAFQLDDTPPAVAVTLDASDRDDLCFTVEASDATTGLGEIRWSVENATGANPTNRTGVALHMIPIENGARACGEIDIEGRYRVIATATDAVGNAGTNASDLVIVDLLPPTLTLEAPLPGIAYAGDVSEPIPQGTGFDNASLVVLGTDILANASDAGSGVARAELLFDGNLSANATSAPFRWTIAPGSLSEGWHNFTIRVWDEVGRSNETTRMFFFASTPRTLPTLATTPTPDVPAPPTPQIALKLEPKGRGNADLADHSPKDPRDPRFRDLCCHARAGAHAPAPLAPAKKAAALRNASALRDLRHDRPQIDISLTAHLEAHL